jgi:hypothetical protein
LNVEYCNLVRNPEKYDGKNITVQATYRYGFEWAEMYCVDCRDVGKTWVQLDQDDWVGSKSSLKRLPKNAGTVNAVFSGTFHSADAHYGHLGAYRFMFTVRSLTKVEKVYNDGRVPEQLPPDARKKACGATSPARLERQ